MNVPSILKRFITEALPESVQLVLTRGHYLRFVAGVTEASESYFSVVAKLVSPGDMVMDVGANIGMYAKFLSDLVGPTGLVYSVEPLPRNIGILDYVKRRLGLDNVSIIRCAASENDGRAELSIPIEESGVENYYRPYIGGVDAARKIEVETRRIDSVLTAQTRRVSFIKIDVEGHELPCVRGAMATLRRDRPALLVEVSKDPDDPTSSAAELTRLLNDLGYGTYAWDDHKVRPRIHGEHQGDYFFFTADHVASLDSRGLVIHSQSTAAAAGR